MRIAIIGAGVTGLVAGYNLQQNGHEVTIFEKNTSAGGLCQGFKKNGWSWYLDYYYHHLFTNDEDILSFARQINYNNIFFTQPVTSSLFDMNSDLRIIPLDTPLDLIKFPLLSIIDRFRSGMLIMVLKLSPYSNFYTKNTSQQLITKISGEKSWTVLWQQLFRKKFGKYAGNILASFIWARVKKRTKNLGYIKGGFQDFTDYLERINVDKKTKILKNVNIKQIIKAGQGFEVVINNNKHQFDAVISTVPTQAMINITENLMPRNYLNNLKRIKYLSALVLVLETDKPIINNTYWLNVCTDKIPMMVFVQHTNFIDRKYYGGKYIAYIGYYLDKNDNLIKKTKSQLFDYLKPYLLEISDNKDFRITDSFKFIGSYAQAIFDEEFIKIKPDYTTPIKNFYIANLDMTFPYDRGVNFAVKMGMEVANLIGTCQS